MEINACRVKKPLLTSSPDDKYRVTTHTIWPCTRSDHHRKPHRKNLITWSPAAENSWSRKNCDFNSVIDNRHRYFYRFPRVYPLVHTQTHTDDEFNRKEPGCFVIFLPCLLLSNLCSLPACVPLPVSPSNSLCISLSILPSSHISAVLAYSLTHRHKGQCWIFNEGLDTQQYQTYKTCQQCPVFTLYIQ